MKKTTINRKVFKNIYLYMHSELNAEELDEIIFSFFSESYEVVLNSSLNNKYKRFKQDIKTIYIYSLYDETSLTMDQIGKKLGISKELVLYHIKKYKKLVYVKDKDFNKTRFIFDFCIKNTYDFLIKYLIEHKSNKNQTNNESDTSNQQGSS